MHRKWSLYVAQMYSQKGFFCSSRADVTKVRKMSSITVITGSVRKEMLVNQAACVTELELKA